MGDGADCLQLPLGADQAVGTVAVKNQLPVSGYEKSASFQIIETVAQARKYTQFPMCSSLLDLQLRSAKRQPVVAGLFKTIKFHTTLQYSFCRV